MDATNAQRRPDSFKERRERTKAAQRSVAGFRHERIRRWNDYCGLICRHLIINQICAEPWIQFTEVEEKFTCFLY